MEKTNNSGNNKGELETQGFCAESGRLSLVWVPSATSRFSQVLQHKQERDVEMIFLKAFDSVSIK